MVDTITMRYTVFVKPNAKENRAESADGGFLVWVKAPAKEGRANDALVRVLAEHLGVAPSRVAIVRGQKTKKKLIEVV